LTNKTSPGVDTDRSSDPAEADGELLRQLAGCLAHNVNNALTGVIGYLELGLRSLSARVPAVDHLQASLDCAFQAAGAVKRIVTFACRPEILPPRQLLSLAALVEQVDERLRGRLRPPLTLQTVCSSPGWVLASESALQTALQQVIDNALEAMPCGGTLQLRVEQCDEWCRLIVADTGAGIAAEILPHLFEPFHTTKTSGHLGLGLVQCRDLMWLLGGRVEVASVAGQGTTVTLLLPAEAPAERLPDGNVNGCLTTTPVEAFDPACYVS